MGLWTFFENLFVPLDADALTRLCGECKANLAKGETHERGCSLGPWQEKISTKAAAPAPAGAPP